VKRIFTEGGWGTGGSAGRKGPAPVRSSAIRVKRGRNKEGGGIFRRKKSAMKKTLIQGCLLRRKTTEAEKAGGAV